MTKHDDKSEDIRQQMARIRRELDEDVHAVVENAREMTDWRSFVKRHPFLTVSAAAAVGFMIVPTRLEVVSPSAETLEKLADKNRLVVKSKPDVRRQASAVSPILNLLGGILMRSAFTIAGQKISKAVNPPADTNSAAPATQTH